MLRRQFVEGSTQATIQLSAGKFGESIAVRIWQALDFYGSLLAPDKRMPPLAAAEVNRQVCRDTIKPGREARTRLEAAEVVNSTLKRLLRKFQGVFLVVYRHKCFPDYAPLVAHLQDT